jgi:hypothetical protein
MKSNRQTQNATEQKMQWQLFEEPKNDFLIPPLARNIKYFLDCYLDRDFLNQKNQREFHPSTTISH